MSRFIRNVSSLSSGINHKSNCLRWRSEFAPVAPALVERSPAPSHELLNDFVRFHALASKGKGRIDKAGRITVDSCLSFMERFYAGFQRRTGTLISEEERQPVYIVSFWRRIQFPSAHEF